jgi:hypothetical protein
MPEKVLEATEDYEDKFFNTSLPILNFGSPAILTLNGRDTDFSYLHRNQIMGNIDELMAVRFRLNTWNVELCLDAISEWAFHVPFLLTDMRYSDIDNVKKPQHYEFKKHLLNEYWKLNEDGMQIILKLLRLRNVFWCGNPLTKSTMCSECRLCEHFYCKTKIKLESI